MALRVKTVEFAFQSRNTVLASATRYDFTAITLYIPENTSRTFRTARIQVFCRDTVTATATLTLPIVGIKLAAVAFSDATLPNPPANTGESQSYIFERDVTSYFNTNFGAGGTQTCQVGVQFTGPTTINIGAKLFLTYEYDDGSQVTRVKTVRIPLDSGLGALTATLAEIGTNQIPALDTMLPEASKVYRNIWFELWYNEHTVGTVNDASLGMQVDSGTEHLTGIHESALASSCAGIYFWDQGASPAWATNVVHAFKLRSSNITTASTFNHVGIILCITYEYNHTNSTTLVNSLVVALPAINLPTANVTDDSFRVEVNLWIEEPGTITQVQGGALVWYTQIGAVNPIINLGAGATRTYVDTNMLFCGASFLSQRCDAGGAGGAAWTLARGLNKIAFEVYVSAVGLSSPNGFCALIFLNYTSDKHADGDGAHNCSTCWSVQDSQLGGTGYGNLITAAQWINIPEAAWFNNGLSFLSMACSGLGTANYREISVESGAGELTGEGWEVQGQAYSHAENENGIYPVLAARNGNCWDRWAGDPESSRMDIEGSRRIIMYSYINWTRPLCIWLTKHSITKSIAGSVTGSGGGTVNIAAWSPTFGKIATTSRVGDGAYSMLWYDDTENILAEGRESSVYLGRSDTGVAV